MLTILLRTLIIYTVLIAIMRMMGKRQIGELEVTDLVTTLLISEVASLPITNTELPVSHAILPMIILLSLEIFSSIILIRFPRLKNLVSARPTVIIQNGTLRQRALRELRISLDELMSEVRQQGYTDLSQIDCAILEKNGVLTLIPKGDFSQPTNKQLGLNIETDALMHIVYSNATFSKVGLSMIGKDRAWLEEQVKRKGLQFRDLLCVTANENGELYWIKKENSKTE